MIEAEKYAKSISKNETYQGYLRDAFIAGVESKINHVWVFYWCDCIYESGFEAVSIHHTAKGAYQSMRKVILHEYEKYLEQRRWSERRYQKEMYLKFGADKGWFVKKVEILP